MGNPNPADIARDAAAENYRVSVQVSSAELLALFATPKELVAAPGVGFALQFVDMNIQKPAGTAYGGIAADEDLAVKYTNAAGLEVAQCETTGFLDSAGDQIRVCLAHHAATGDSSVVLVANAALVLHLLNAEIITGTSPLNCIVTYRIYDTTPQA